jgi:hypothetical protein
MKKWISDALELLSKSLDPIPQELNQLDWKKDKSFSCIMNVPVRQSKSICGLR